MKTSLILLLSLLLSGFCQAQLLPQKEEDEAWTYQELIDSYKKLAALYLNASYLELGHTDAGRPLSLFLIQQEPFSADLSLSEIRAGKVVTLINNGIHPGESCGMDASLKLAAQLLAEGGPGEGQLIAIIPVYNIGGSLKARPNTRANQNGPRLQGFRANALNLDLNRDFIKGDALNTFSFWTLFQNLRPHIFIDTHTSNGADYPYTISLIASQQDKLAPPLRDFMYGKMVPTLYREMAQSWPMIPYVNVFGRPPNSGYAAFLDLPRYASGYTSLFHAMSFITEAHMFKPYPDRVAATKDFLRLSVNYARDNSAAIKAAYKASLEWEAAQGSFSVAWELDSNQREKRPFRSYRYSYEESELGNYQRLKYHRDEEEALSIDYYPHYQSTQRAKLPQYYIIPQAWRGVIKRLQYHNIKMQALPADTILKVVSVYLKDWVHQTKPYEGHFRTEVLALERREQKRLFYAGDYLVETDQNPYFLASVLDPMAADSYLSWGFFNSIFQPKEYFSPYVFEDKAMEMLATEPQLKLEFEAWQKEHPEKQNQAWAVLSYFYERSDYYEVEHLRYPLAELH